MVELWRRDAGMPQSWGLLRERSRQGAKDKFDLRQVGVDLILEFGLHMANEADGSDQTQKDLCSCFLQADKARSQASSGPVVHGLTHGAGRCSVQILFPGRCHMPPLRTCQWRRTLQYSERSGRVIRPCTHGPSVERLAHHWQTTPGCPHIPCFW